MMARTFVARRKEGWCKKRPDTIFSVSNLERWVAISGR